MAQTQTITIARALNTLKHLKVEIDDYFKTQRYFAGFQFGSSGANTNVATMNAKQLTETIQGNYDKIDSLMRRQLALKTAIAKSNVETFITVNGRSMSVSEAIITRSLIESRVILLKQMRNVNSNLNTEMEKLQTKFEERVITITKESMSENMPAEERAQVTVNVRRVQEDMVGPRPIDPLRLAEKVKTLEEEINFLKSELDHVLNESNTTTTITIEV